MDGMYVVIWTETVSGNRSEEWREVFDHLDYDTSWDGARTAARNFADYLRRRSGARNVRALLQTSTDGWITVEVKDASKDILEN